jgi:hypothetical protein
MKEIPNVKGLIPYRVIFLGKILSVEIGVVPVSLQTVVSPLTTARVIFCFSCEGTRAGISDRMDEVINACAHAWAG